MSIWAHPLEHDRLKRRCYNQLSNTKQRARKKNLKFNLTFEWLWDKWKSGICDKTYMPFCFYLTPLEDRKPGEQFNPWAPSIDRVDSSKGYTQDNCNVVIWMYNSCKQVFDHDDVVRFANQVVRSESLKKLTDIL